MAYVELTFRIQALSALHIGTGLGLAGVVDRRTARRLHTPVDGKDIRLVYIPGSSVKGRLRHHFTQLARELKISVCGPDQHCRPPSCCPRCVLFGSEALEGQLVFHDAPLTQEWQNLAYEKENGTWLKLSEFFETEHRTNVSLSRRRGVAMEQRLFASEVVARGLDFDAKVTGEVEGLVPALKVNGVDVPAEIVLLIVAARTVTHIGGSKSPGLGRCRIHAYEIKVDGKTLSEEKVLSALTGDVIRRWQNALAHQG